MRRTSQLFVLAALMIASAYFSWRLSSDDPDRLGDPLAKNNLKRLGFAEHGRNWAEDACSEARLLSHAGNPRGAEALGELLMWNKFGRLGIDLTGVNMDSVFLHTLVHSEATLHDVSLSKKNANNIPISFENCNLNASLPPKVPLRGVKFQGSRFPTETITLWGESMEGRGLEWADLSGVDLSSVDSTSISFRGANLSGTGVRIAPGPLHTIDRRFEGAILDGALFSQDDLTGLSLRHCDLREVGLTPSQLAQVARNDGGTGLHGAILPPVDFRDQDLGGVSFLHSDIRRVKLSENQLLEIGARFGGNGFFGAAMPLTR